MNALPFVNPQTGASGNSLINPFTGQTFANNTIPQGMLNGNSQNLLNGLARKTSTLDDYKRVLSDLRSWLGPVHIFLSGGEALLRPYTPDALAHGASVGLSMGILTHGYWDDQSRIERVALANPWRVTVSVDAASATHDKVRGREKFWEKTHTTLRRCCG